MTNFKDKVPDNTRGFNSQRINKEGDKLNKGKGIQYHESEGFRNIQEDCTNLLSKQKKGILSHFQMKKLKRKVIKKRPTM